MRVFSESYSNVGWTKAGPCPLKSAAATRRIIETLARSSIRTPTPSFITVRPFELLVATILSAQSTDARVNLVTPALFERYPDARALAAAETARSRAADSVHGVFPPEGKSADRMAQQLVAPRRSGSRGHGRNSRRCPASAARRRTSCSVTRSAVPGLPVDRHVLRVSNRIGIAEGDDPEEVESQLCAAAAEGDVDARLRRR